MYFASHLLKDSETRYPTLEKLVLVLVITAHKLYPYFLSLPIMVLTNTALGQALTKSESSVRLIKWMMKLSEYDIQYQSQTTIKAQTLGYFLIETLGQVHKTWKIFINCSSTKQGSGVRVLLISP